MIYYDIVAYQEPSRPNFVAEIFRPRRSEESISRRGLERLFHRLFGESPDPLYMRIQAHDPIREMDEQRCSLLLLKDRALHDIKQAETALHNVPLLKTPRHGEEGSIDL